MSERFTADKTMVIGEGKLELISFQTQNIKITSLLENENNEVLTPYIYEIDNTSIPPFRLSDLIKYQNLSLKTSNIN